MRGIESKVPPSFLLHTPVLSLLLSNTMSMFFQPIASTSRSASAVFRRCLSSTSRRAAEKAPEAAPIGGKNAGLRSVLSEASRKAANSPAAAEAAARGGQGSQQAGGQLCSSLIAGTLS